MNWQILLLFGFPIIISSEVLKQKCTNRYIEGKTEALCSGRQFRRFPQTLSNSYEVNVYVEITIKVGPDRHCAASNVATQRSLPLF